MKRYHGTETAPKGVYLNLTSGEYAQLYEEPYQLPGRGETSYIKVPAFLAAISGPFLGLAFIIFLPLVGILGTLGFLAVKGWRAVSGAGEKVVRPAAAVYEPGTTFLTPAGEGKGGEAAPDKEIEALENEVDKRRQGGEQ